LTIFCGEGEFVDQPAQGFGLIGPGELLFGAPRQSTLGEAHQRARE
jgi:hypothetical protein